MKSTGRSDRAVYIALDALQSRELHCSQVLGNPGETQKFIT